MLSKFACYPKNNITGGRGETAKQSDEFGFVGGQNRDRYGSPRVHQLSQGDAKCIGHPGKHRQAEGTVAGFKARKRHGFNADRFRKGFLRPSTITTGLGNPTANFA